MSALRVELFFRRHSDDDPGQAVPGREFLNACPVKVRATMRAVLAQVAAAPSSLPAVLPPGLRRRGPPKAVAGRHLRTGQAVPDGPFSGRLPARPGPR
jgi:hypothetical protein